MSNFVTADIIEIITLAHPEIAAIKIHPYPTPKSIENRIPFGKLELDHFNDALTFRDKTKVTFWDSLMISYFEREFISDNILAHMLNHHAKRDKITIERSDIVKHKLKQYSNSDQNIAINSEITLNNGKKRHFVLLDFHIPASDRNQKVVESLLKALHLNNGYLLASGKSFHFIGANIVSGKKLNEILHKSLFYSPIIDKYWIAHQLLDHSCSLRLTKKHGSSPQMIKRIL